MEPLDRNAAILMVVPQQTLHCPRKATTAIVAFDFCDVDMVVMELRRYRWLGNFHWLIRINDVQHESLPGKLPRHNLSLPVSAVSV